MFATLKSMRFIFTTSVAAGLSFLGTWSVTSLGTAVWVLPAVALASFAPLLVTSVFGPSKE